MPAHSPKETMQSAQQVQAAASQVIAAVQTLERVRSIRDNVGSVQFDQLTAAQMETLGINDPSQLNKLVDGATDLRDGWFDRCAAAQGSAG